MKKNHQIAIAGVIIALVGLFAVLSMEPAKSTRSGKVIDVATRKPMANVFVLAAYYRGGTVPFGHSATWCVKTRAVRTGTDGVFSFPQEKGASVRISATAPGYVDVFTYRMHKVETWLGTKEIESSDVYMAKRGTGDDERLDIVNCRRPETKADAAANAEYLRLILVEENKYDPNDPSAINSMIGMLESEREN